MSQSRPAGPPGIGARGYFILKPVDSRAARVFVCGCMCTARLRGPYLVHFNIAAAAQLLTSRHQMIPSESEEKHPKKERERERASSGER